MRINSTGPIGPGLLRLGPWLLGSIILLVVLACGGAATATTPLATLVVSPETPTGIADSTAQSGSGTLAEVDKNTALYQTADIPPAGTEVGATIGVSGTIDETTNERLASRPPEVPVLDRSIHSVPLEDILFDTFGGSPRFLPLDQASDKHILRLRDLIKPISEPAYGLAEDLPWLNDRDLVIGYNSGDGAYAYPVNVLDFHEMVSDIIDGVPVLITYCPLCFSGVVYM